MARWVEMQLSRVFAVVALRQVKINNAVEHGST